jgi:hypothetical protein
MSSQYPPHEGLQVAFGRGGHDAPEVFEIQGSYRPGPEKYATEELLLRPAAGSATTFCGLRRRTFWMVFGIVVGVIVIAAAVGGGVGGSLASKKSQSKDVGRSVSRSCPGSIKN